MLYRINNALSERTIDDNGYMFVKKSPILRSGVLEYYGKELLPENETTVDGVEVDPDKVYKVFIPEEELNKCASTFKLKPITDDHTWLGDEGEDAKDYQVGSTGENVFVENGMLYVPLEFTGKDVVEKIMAHEKEELSSSYYNRFEKSNNPDYDFVARDIKGNHLALVDRGRCGSSVRVLNAKKECNIMKKVANTAILELDGKRIDLDQFFDEEKEERDAGENPHEDSISENESVDKRALIDEIGGILKDKVDDETIRTVMEKAEKLAYNDSETSSDNKCENEDKDAVEQSDGETDGKEDDEVKSEALASKVANAIRVENAKAEQEKVKAYNAACGVIGDFNPFGMTAKDMYVKALNHLGVELNGKESSAELSAMLKACSSISSKVDNGFSYDYSETKEEKNFNI